MIRESSSLFNFQDTGKMKIDKLLFKNPKILFQFLDLT